MKIKKIVTSFLLISSSLLAGVNSSATAKVSAVVTNREPELTIVKDINIKSITKMKKILTGNVEFLVEAFEDTTGTGEAEMRIVYPAMVELKNSNVIENTGEIAVLRFGDVQGAIETKSTLQNKLSVIRTKVDRKTSWQLPYAFQFKGEEPGVYTATVPLIINYN